MTDLATWQYVTIGLIFIWSGFVRSGLGFGGAALALPLLLLVVNEPLFFLPIISIQLLIFSSWIAWTGYKQSKALKKSSPESALDGGNINWAYLKKSLKIIIVPKLLGVLGLLTLPAQWVTIIIFAMISFFAVSYIINKPFKSNHKGWDLFFLGLGGYFSGTSLIGAPLIVSVYAAHVPRHQIRDTLFVLWFILVLIKMASFIFAGVNLQLIQQLWLLPCAFVGHILGTKFHEYIQTQSNEKFFRVIGVALLLVCTVGIATNLTS
ncbi:TSUP family transporter [Reinekea marina]|uniref:Probable membrane transporter protein n=1 Tax=Reinekea marina TaxID=1310421 RepID=A0ABV7WR78_9GAMM|nr:TSUP family transporter [Reinekea marina]MBU2864070.1 TSUP family transporter [Reinekea forsetii]MDN3648022.1 TSUP family transporter [Reinekea marina]